ncbi:hypothetical protein [Nonomuraea sp. NPDC050783]|uniref:hypothetical protein n=1 Tax=Nonomuraea sp. NPDC050783 TaxID=3154634 RepID=UPI003466EA68
MNLATSEQESARERLTQQVACAGLAGALLPFVQAGWTLLVLALTAESRWPVPPQQAWESGRWAVLVLVWPLLCLLKVRPAWPVALAGPAFLLPVQLLAADLAGMAIVLAGVFAYPFAVLATAREAGWWRRALALGLYAALCGFLAVVPGSAVSVHFT